MPGSRLLAPRRIALYGRVSSGSDEQANALEQQLARLEAAAAGRGCPEPLRYVDVASGSRDDRPELQRLLADCRALLVDEVLVTRLDRLSRSSSHGAEMLRYFQQEDTPNLVALDDAVDLSTPGGRFMARLLINWAESETDRLSERVRHGMAHRKAAIKPLGRVPFGYRLSEDRSRLEPDPLTWPIAQQIVRHFFASGCNFSAAEGLSARLGKDWGSLFSMRRWMASPVVAGGIPYGKRQGTKDNRAGVYREIHWDRHEPLMSREEYARVLALLESRRLPAKRELAPGRTRLLTGLARCEHCGKAMGTRTMTPKTKPVWFQLRCHHSGCPVRFANACPELEAVMEASITLAQHAEQITHDRRRSKAAREQRLPPEALALQEKIGQLEAMEDPDLLEVIDAKRAQLAQVIAQAKVEGSHLLSFAEEVAHTADMGFWAEGYLHHKEVLRMMLVRYLSAVWIANGKPVAVDVHPTIRIPGSTGRIDIHWPPAPPTGLPG